MCSERAASMMKIHHPAKSAAKVDKPTGLSKMAQRVSGGDTPAGYAHKQPAYMVSGFHHLAEIYTNLYFEPEHIRCNA